jgi:dTDP-4-amino-4,6-dideoxygalactose transaminase
LIPFNDPQITDEQIDLVVGLLKDPKKLAGDGPFTKKCHKLLCEISGAKKALLTTSCTDALEMTSLLLNLKEGDEVIVPSFTFVSTANAYVLSGARPTFVDIRSDTLNIDEKLIESAITSKTKAIVVVHYAGISCEMDHISQVAKRHGLAVIEDNAHGLFGSFKNRSLGSFGDFATLSFHETKNITCGEGGALLINTEDYFARAEIIREKGTDRSRFLRGEVDKYSWVDKGSSFLPSEILAALLYGQLKNAEKTQLVRQFAWAYYNRELKSWANENGIKLPSVPQDCEPAYHIFYLILPKPQERDRFAEHLKASGIGAATHYLPLHLSTMGRKMDGQVGDCPITENVCDRLIRLPLHSGLNSESLEKVVSAVTSFRVHQ